MSSLSLHRVSIMLPVVPQASRKAGDLAPAKMTPKPLTLKGPLFQSLAGGARRWSVDQQKPGWTKGLANMAFRIVMLDINCC
jgi:hypothetical protein